MDLNITIEYKKRKKLSIKIKDGKVKVFAPFFTSKKTIEKFVNDNKEVILKHVNQQNEIIKNKEINFNDIVIVLNKKFQILSTSLKDKKTNNFIFINKNSQDIRKDIKRLFKDEALNYFQATTLKYFNIMKINKNLPEIKIRDNKSKWGSYNRNNNSITYSSELIFKDEEICTMVVVHELSHMIEFNHSKKFYDILAKYCPNYKIINNRLKAGG